MTDRAKTGGARVDAYRRRLRARGLRPVQLWVSDTRQDGFEEEARRQAKLASRSPHAADDQTFVDAISAWPDEDGD